MVRAAVCRRPSDPSVSSVYIRHGAWSVPHYDRHRKRSLSPILGLRSGGDDSGHVKDIRHAREDMTAAWHDIRSVAAGDSSAMMALRQQTAAVVQQRLDTFRAALAAFTSGYAQGSREVRYSSPSACNQLDDTSSSPCTCLRGGRCAQPGSQMRCVHADGSGRLGRAQAGGFVCVGRARRSRSRL